MGGGVAMARYYAGIGSRKTPLDVGVEMMDIARRLRASGWTLRSGAARGADSFFETGAGSASQIFVPWPGFDGRPMIWSLPPEARDLAAQLHPRWMGLSAGAKSLMARNCQQVLGPHLDSPSEFVLCWTPDGCESIHERTSATGGTGLAIALASAIGVPVINMQRDDWRNRLTEFTAL